MSTKAHQNLLNTIKIVRFAGWPISHRQFDGYFIIHPGQCTANEFTEKSFFIEIKVKDTYKSP